MSQIHRHLVNSGFDSDRAWVQIRNMSKNATHPELTNQYPAIEGEVFSLRRLASQMIAGRPLSPKFRVGGRYLFDANHFSINDGGGSLQLTGPIAEARHGDILVIEVEAKSLQAKTELHGKLVGVVSGDLNAQIVCRHKLGSELTTFNSLPVHRWADFLAQVRTILVGLGMVEVQTPTLVCNPGMEPELEPFSTNFKNGSQHHGLFFATSPELHLKQLLCRGMTDIFEIKTVFRNEELTPLHEPEFLMLEWYRAFANLSVIEADLKTLVQTLIERFSGRQAQVSRFTVAELFALHTGFELAPATKRQELFDLAAKKGLGPSEKFDFNDIFNLIWVALIEPKLPSEPFLLVDYPPSQAALARIGASGWADRCEFYWHGFEIANAFNELNNPQEQRARFVHDQQKRIEYGRTELKIDENFMSALEMGLPPSGGIALGLDRLFMALYGYKSILATRPFGVAHVIRGVAEKK